MNSHIEPKQDDKQDDKQPWRAPQLERLVITLDTAKGGGSGSDALDMEVGVFDVEPGGLIGGG